MIITMRNERVLMAFFVAIAFALTLVIAFSLAPVPAKASIIAGMATPQYATTGVPHMQPPAVATTTQALPVKTIESKRDAQAIQLAELIQKIKELRALIAKFQAQKV